jgi:hypothetical protein
VDCLSVAVTVYVQQVEVNRLDAVAAVGELAGSHHEPMIALV